MSSTESAHAHSHLRHLTPDVQQLLIEATSGSPVTGASSRPDKSSLMCPSYAALVTSEPCVPDEVSLTVDEQSLERLGSNQVSGHAVIFKLSDGRILKRSNVNEVTAYKQLQLHASLLPFTAKYYGFARLDLKHTATTTRQLDHSASFRRDNTFIILEDLTAGCARPCLMDVKLGVSTLDDQVVQAADKVARKTRKAQQTTSGRYGARVDGLHVYQTRTGAEIRSGREAWHKSLAESFFVFLHTGEASDIREDVIGVFIAQLADLHAAMTKHRFSMSFAQSSLLFIYDSDPAAPLRARVALIDFDHAHFEDPHAEPHCDHSACGCAFGIANLVLALHTLLVDQARAAGLPRPASIESTSE